MRCCRRPSSKAQQQRRMCTELAELKRLSSGRGDRPSTREPRHLRSNRCQALSTTQTHLVDRRQLLQRGGHVVDLCGKASQWASKSSARGEQASKLTTAKRKTTAQHGRSGRCAVAKNTWYKQQQLERAAAPAAAGRTRVLALEAARHLLVPRHGPQVSAAAAAGHAVQRIRRGHLGDGGHPLLPHPLVQPLVDCRQGWRRRRRQQ